MTSPSTSCPKLPEKEVHNWKKGQEQLAHSFLRVQQVSTSSCSHPSCSRYYSFIPCTGSTAANVIPFRERVSMAQGSSIHTHLYITSQGGGGSCWLKKEDKEKSRMLRKVWEEENKEEEQYNTEYWDELGSLRRACARLYSTRLPWCNAEISNPITAPTSLAA